MQVLKTKDCFGETNYHGLTMKTGDGCTLCGLMYEDGDDYDNKFLGIKKGKITCSTCLGELRQYKLVIEAYKNQII